MAMFLLLFLMVLLACAYVTYYMRVPDILQIVQCSIKDLPDVLGEKRPVVVQGGHENIVDVLRWTGLYTVSKLSNRDQLMICHARYAILSTAGEHPQNLDIIHPRHTRAAGLITRIIVRPGVCVIIPFRYGYRTHGHFLQHLVVDVFTAMYSCMCPQP
jgi:hypothetical protein